LTRTDGSRQLQHRPTLRPVEAISEPELTETAEFLGLSRQRVRMLIESGQLPAQKVGPMWIVADKDARACKRLPPGTAVHPRKLG
jgi:excisionase family DNA binding protein